MGPSEIVRGFTIVAFIAVAVVAYRQRRGGIANQWIFLSFTLLAAINVILAMLDDESTSPQVASARRVTVAFLPLFPYFLFRFTASLTRPRRWLEWVATTSTAAVVVMSLVSSGGGIFKDRPAWHSVALLSHWTFLSVATSIRLWQVGRDEPTVARRRIRTFGIATITLTVTLVLAIATRDNPLTDTIVRLAALMGALLFLLALAPPPRMRAAWRRSEEERLHRAIAELMSATTTEQVTGVLLPCVAKLLGARGAAVVSGEGALLRSYGNVTESVDEEIRRTELVQLSTGSLVVFTGTYTPLFGHDEFELVRSLADLAEIALERSKEHHIAETLQRSLLPRELPDTPGVRVEVRYLPGEEGAVGGDWYDVIPLPDGRVGLAIGDVMGHGIDAAALMGHLRSGLRAYAIDGDAPATVLTRLDRLMHHLGVAGIATVLYLVLDLDEGTVTYSSAGHLPAAVRQRGGSPHFLEGGLGPPLGVWDEPAQQSSATVGPGTALLLFTDGLVERRDEGLDVGLDRLREVLESTPEGDGVLCDRVLSELLPQGNSSDDVAMLLVELVGKDGRSTPVRAEEAHIALPSNLRSAGEARRFVSSALAAWGRADADHTVVLLTTEVVTNAVIHAESSVFLTVRMSDDAVRISVDDGNARMPVLGSGGLDEESGRGLLLLDALAARWGTEPVEGGKRVWFEVPVGPAQVPAVLAR